MAMNGLWARMEFEMFMGNNARCLQCGHEFLQHEDGCPYCGAGARTVSTVESVKYEDCKPERGPNGYCIFIFEDGTFQVVSNENFSHWPREMEVEDDVFCQMTFDKETGEFFALDGSFSPWPREMESS